MNKLKISLIITSFFLFTSPVQAACNFISTNDYTNSKNISDWVTECTIDTDTIEGLDNATLDTDTTNAGTLTLGEDGAITINDRAELILGSLELNGGNVAIQEGGIMRIGGPLYVVDADADGWAYDFTIYNATDSGRRRLALMHSFASADCDDNNPSDTNSCCTVGTYYADNDGDGYGAGSAQSICPTAGYVDNNYDCNDSSTSIRTTNITGGTITSSGSYKIHKFTSSSTLTVSCIGTGSTLSTEYLIVGGGGGGGAGAADDGQAGGGGGGGGALAGTGSSVSTGGKSIVVGAGGSGGIGSSSTSGNNGGNSSFNGLTAYGGGRGAGMMYSGGSGGTGGGGGLYAPGSGTSGQGYAGGTGINDSKDPAGGGGGAGSAGVNATTGVAGNGGSGKSSSITGSATYYGGGGGGGILGALNDGTAGTGGTGGGGNGARSYTGANGTNGTNGLGGGGGGAQGSGTGGTGGSGVVIIRYLNP